MSNMNNAFDVTINNLFYNYTDNPKNVDHFLKKLNNIETSRPLEVFYKNYILNLIYLNLEEYKKVFSNAKVCLSIYEKLTSFDKDIYRSEYLFSRYYEIMLTEYFDKHKGIKDELEKLKKEIQIQPKNPILHDLIQKINLYFYTTSNSFDIDSLFKNMKDFNFNDYSFFYKKTVSKIIGQNNPIEFASHYTTIRNSFNILENKELWVSRYDFLNDKSELKYIQQVLKEIISDLKGNNKTEIFNKDEKVFMMNQIKIVERIMSYYTDKLSHNKLTDDEKHLVDNFKLNYHFVLSFSKNKDSLALWGNYTEFNGVNLVFSNNNLTSSFNNINPDDDLNYFINPNYKKDKQKELFSTLYFGEVIYNLKSIKELLLTDYRKILDLHKKNSKIVKESVVTRILIELTLIRRLFIKINYFSCEEEYRFVFILDEDLYHQKVNFRCAKDNYIPFIKIPITVSNLHEIIVGPRNNSDLVVRGFKEYVNHHNLKVIINKSHIPFR